MLLLKPGVRLQGEHGSMYSNTDNTWAGEKYETVAPRGVTATFLKFRKRMGRCPRQCVRYGCALSHAEGFNAAICDHRW